MTEQRRQVARLIVFPICVRRHPEEVWAELRLPADLSEAEAERVAAYVRTLALPPVGGER